MTNFYEKKKIFLEITNQVMKNNPEFKKGFIEAFYEEHEFKIDELVKNKYDIENIIIKNEELKDENEELKSTIFNLESDLEELVN